MKFNNFVNLLIKLVFISFMIYYKLIIHYLNLIKKYKKNIFFIKIFIFKFKLKFIRLINFYKP